MLLISQQVENARGFSEGMTKQGGNSLSDWACSLLGVAKDCFNCALNNDERAIFVLLTSRFGAG